MTSLFWLAPDPEGNQTAFLATSNEALNQAPAAELLENLLSGCYEAELFYLSSDDGCAILNEKTCELSLSNHNQILLTLATNSDWIQQVKQAQCFIWVLGLDERSEQFQHLPLESAQKLLRMMQNEGLITLTVIAAPNDSESVPLKI